MTEYVNPETILPVSVVQPGFPRTSEMDNIAAIDNSWNDNDCCKALHHYIFAGLGWAWLSIITTQPIFICSKLTLETLEQGVKYVES